MSVYAFCPICNPKKVGKLSIYYPFNELMQSKGYSDEFIGLFACIQRYNPTGHIDYPLDEHIHKIQMDLMTNQKVI